jgi:predicted DNA-binding transcriptional regulator AlpA
MTTVTTTEVIMPSLTKATNPFALGPLPDAPEILRAEEVAQRLGVSPKTLANWRWRGIGPAFVKFGEARGRGVIRYEAKDIEVWLASRRHRGGE